MKRTVSILVLLTMLVSMCMVSGAFAQEEPVAITFQTWNPGEGSKIKEIITAFEAENPDVKVNYVYMPYSDYLADLEVKMFSGGGPDVYGMNAGAPYGVFRDFEEDITPYAVATDGEQWKDSYLPFCMNLLAVDDSYYGIPLGLTYAGLLWADMNYFTKYGLDVPANYTALKAVCDTFRANGELPLLIGAKDGWINADTFTNIAGDVDSEAFYGAIDGTVSWECDAMVEAFQIWSNCFTEGIFQDGAVGINMYTDAWDMFGTHSKAPMMANGSWVMDSYLSTDPLLQEVFNAEDSNHKPFLVDWNNDGVSAGLAASIDVVLCMNTNSQHKEAAWKWMNYLANQGQDVLINQSMSYCPSRTDIALAVEGMSANGEENLAYIVAAAEVNTKGYRTIPYADLDEQLSECLTALATGEMTPVDAAAAMEAVSASIER